MSRERLASVSRASRECLASDTRVPFNLLVDGTVCEGELQRDGEEMTGEGVEPLVSSCTTSVDGYTCIHKLSSPACSVQWTKSVRALICVCACVYLQFKSDPTPIPPQLVILEVSALSVGSFADPVWSNHLFYWAPVSNYVS